jgi:HAMP domain-containing protein
MSLLLRINLSLALTFAIALIAVGYACSAMLESNAKREVLEQAGLMMDSALASRAYTSDEIGPLLEPGMRTQFLPQTIPFYAASQQFLKLREHHPDFAYKEAALNPTNPRDRATDWEADLIQQFRNDPHTRQIIGARDTPMGKSLYLARPISSDHTCLACHGLPNAAPAALLARYGSNNGFGWQDHDVIGAQVVSVPFASAAASARTIFRRVMTAITTILLIALVIVNWVLYFSVVRPIRRIAAIADEVSLGNTQSGEFPLAGSGELAALRRSFERMRISLNKALRMLEP